MALAPNEMAVMAFADTQLNGHRWFSYINSAGDDLSAADFFLPYFTIKDLPITNQQPAGALGDLIYDVENGIWYRITTFTITAGQVAAVTLTDVIPAA